MVFECGATTIPELEVVCEMRNSDLDDLFEDMFTFRSSSSAPDTKDFVDSRCDGDDEEAVSGDEISGSNVDQDDNRGGSVCIDTTEDLSGELVATNEQDESPTPEHEVCSCDLVCKADSASEEDSPRSGTLEVTQRLPSLTRPGTCSELTSLRVRSAGSPRFSSGTLCHAKSATLLYTPIPTGPRVVVFDVRGSRFQCEENLIASFPHKRLHQIVSRRYNTDSLTETISIDCNPRHFEAILDWYRSGNLVRPCSVNEEAFVADVAYFDLQDEIVQPNNPIRKSNNLAASMPLQDSKTPLSCSDGRHSRLVGDGNALSSISTSHSPLPELDITARMNSGVRLQQPDQDDKDLEPSRRDDEAQLRFFRRERRLLRANSIPLVYVIREHEKLLVESVKGCGRLMVRVCDVTGMQTVHVAEAVLYDSRARFYLEGGRAQLEHNALLPGNYTYTFWMDESSANQARIKGADKEALDVEFKLLFTFRCSEKLEDAVDTNQKFSQLPQTGGNDPNPEKTPPVQRRTKAFSPTLFLPPAQLQRHPGSQSVCAHSYGKASESGSPPPKLRLSPLSKHNQHAANLSHPSSIRHAGAAIARSQLPLARHAEGKITIYRPDKLNLLSVKDSRNAKQIGQWPAVNIPGSSTIHQTVQAECRHLQPRVFR